MSVGTLSPPKMTFPGRPARADGVFLNCCWLQQGSVLRHKNRDLPLRADGFQAFPCPYISETLQPKAASSVGQCAKFLDQKAVKIFENDRTPKKVICLETELSQQPDNLRRAQSRQEYKIHTHAGAGSVLTDISG